MSRNLQRKQKPQLSGQNEVAANQAPAVQDNQTAQAIIQQKVAMAEHQVAMMEQQQAAQPVFQPTPLPVQPQLQPVQMPVQIVPYTYEAPPAMPPQRDLAAENALLMRQIANMQARDQLIQSSAAPLMPQQYPQPQYAAPPNPMLRPAKAQLPADQVGPDGKFKELGQLFAEGQFQPLIPPNMQPQPQPMMYPPQQPPFQLNTPPERIMPMAPTSRQEYQAMHNPLWQGQYPDVVDIFNNRAPGQAPIHGVPQMVAPPPPPPQQPIRYENTWQPPSQALAYKVISPFTACLGGDVTRLFQTGEVIYDTVVLDQLMQAGSQYIVPIAGSDRFICCPCGCKHRFPIAAAETG